MGQRGLAASFRLRASGFGRGGAEKGHWPLMLMMPRWLLEAQGADAHDDGLAAKRAGG